MSNTTTRTTFVRNRCEQCFSIHRVGTHKQIRPGIWRARCPNCGHTQLVEAHRDGHRFCWVRRNLTRKRPLWSLFMLFIWIPAIVADEKLRLKQLLPWAVTRLGGRWRHKR